MVTKKDCIEAIEGYPPHVVELMLDEQERQGNPRNVAVFQKKADAGYFEGGFTWGKSVKGPMFWSSIHNGHKFEIAIPESKVEASKEVAKKIIEKPVEKPEQSEEIEVGTKVLVKFLDGRVEGRTKERKKTVISVLNTEKRPVYVCVSDALLQKLLSVTTTTSGISSHTIDELKIDKVEPEKVKLTLKDISEGKGVGIPPELIEIVN
jgi:hypothetical protein